MEYAQLLQGVEYTGTPPAGSASLVTQDNRKVVPGAVFVAVQGSLADGHNYAEQALQAGAGMLVTQRRLGLPNEIVVPNSRRAFALLSHNYFGNPAGKLTLVAVTGTNGKTTVSTVLQQVLQSCGHRCGLIGTVHSQIGDMQIPARFTTPEAWDLAALLARMVSAGCTHVVMEASSQALAQQRLYGLHFALGIFTNLTQDHLDYHQTMEAYFKAKLSLFSQCSSMLVNADDPWGARVLAEGASAQKYSFAVQAAGAAFGAAQLQLQAGGVQFSLSAQSRVCQVHFPMPGEYSVYNALAVAGGAMLLGCRPQPVVQALAASRGVPGRCQVLHSGAFTILRDFAHTDDALEKLLGALRPFVQGRMLVLFGCAGDRDPAKRAPMGAIAAKYGDILFLTSDNPRTEPLADIFAAALPPLQNSGKPYQVIPDREEAVLCALSQLQPGDMLVLCGKGHEDYQVMDGYTLYVNEAQIVEEWLRAQKPAT